MPGRDVLIANGFDRYHLLTAAAEVERRARLDCCIAGFYPTARLCGRLAKLGVDGQPRLARLLDRKVALPDARLRTMPVLETAGHLAGRLLGHHAIRAARHVFARKAGAIVSASGAGIYHYRSGFGHGSAIAARRAGMVTVCDHSIVHPALLAYLIEHQGRLPAPGEKGVVSPLWADVIADLGHADRVLVNSGFVKATFVHQGFDPARIEVIHQGLDDGFFAHLPGRPAAPPDGPLRLVFAGAFEQRKGADHLAAALAALDDLPWRLELIGPHDDGMARRHRRLLDDPRVLVLGRVGRQELAARLAAADVFLFPSLAEGSARVVFEALAAGCYIVTTPNSGSIVEDGIHGALAEPDRPETTAAALRAAHGDRGRLRAIGERNAALIRRSYRQSHYGDALIALYDRLLEQKASASEREAA